MQEYQVIVYNNRTEWYKEGQLHRLDGPAVEYPNGTRMWYKEGKLHRTDGPAVEYPNGTRVWWLNGQRHRLDGPAIEYADGTQEWWLNDQQLTREEFLNQTTTTELTLDQIAEKFNIPVQNLKIKK